MSDDSMLHGHRGVWCEWCEEVHTEPDDELGRRYDEENLVECIGEYSWSWGAT